MNDLPMDIDGAHSTLPEALRVWQDTIIIKFTNVALGNICTRLRRWDIEIHAKFAVKFQSGTSAYVAIRRGRRLALLARLTVP